MQLWLKVNMLLKSDVQGGRPPRLQEGGEKEDKEEGEGFGCMVRYLNVMCCFVEWLVLCFCWTYNRNIVGVLDPFGAFIGHVTVAMLETLFISIYTCMVLC